MGQLGRSQTLTLVTILVVVLAAVLYNYFTQPPDTNADSTNDGLIQPPDTNVDSTIDGLVRPPDANAHPPSDASQMDESSNSCETKLSTDDTVPTERESFHNGDKKAACSLSKVQEPPNIPRLLSFPILRKCREVNIMEKIGARAYSNFGILLLEDEGGRKVNTILKEQGGSFEEATKEILKQWLKKKEGKPVTWCTLIDVLKLDSVGLKNLATDIQTSCDPSILDTPPQWYPFDHVMQLADDLRENYSNLILVDPFQNLLKNLRRISYNIPFVMPQLSDGNQFDDVLNELEVGSRLLITGRPGVGKSTLTRYTAQMWANNSLLHHCQLLIRVPLYDTMESLKALLVKYTDKAEGSKTLELVVEEITESKGKGVCLLLDSFDEYRRHQGGHRNDFILNLFKNRSDRQALSKATIIVTSRPEAVGDIRDYFELFGQMVEISGFERESVISYIEKLDSPYKETITTTLEKNPNIMFLCSTPLHLTMMIRLAYFDKDMLSYLTTETSLYIHFLLLTFQQYKEDRLSWTTDSLEECFVNKLSQTELCLLFRNISKLAYDAMMNGNQSFNSTLLPEEYRYKAATMSLFSIEILPTLLDDYTVFVYYFSHRTFLEFIVASQLYLLPQEKQTNEIYLYLDIQHDIYGSKLTNLVMKYFFGLLGMYDRSSLYTNFKYMSFLSRQCCNMSKLMKIGCSNNQLLEYAYESQMKERLGEIVKEVEVIIVGPTFIDELRFSLATPRDCVLLDYALQYLTMIRRLVLTFHEPGTYDCIALSKIGYKPLITDLKLSANFAHLFKKATVGSNTTKYYNMNLPLHLHLRYDTLVFEFGHASLLYFRETLKPEVAEQLVTSQSVNETIKSLVSLKSLTSVRNFTLDIPLRTASVMIISEVIKRMPHLHTLSLRITNMNTTAANMLAKSLGHLYHLKSLTIEHDNTLELTDKDFSALLFTLQNILSNVKELEHLRIILDNRPHFTESFMINCTKLLLDLFNLKQLRKLELTISNNHCIEKDSGYINVDVQNQSTKLEYLSIGGSLTTPQEEQLFKLIEASPHLKFLEITATIKSYYGPNRLSIIGACCLRNLTSLENLKVNTPARDTSDHTEWVVTLNESKQLAEQLKDLKSLKRLQVSEGRANITYFDKPLSSLLLKSLSNIMPLLVELDLSYNNLDTNGARVLAKSLLNATQLTKLNLHRTELGDFSLKEIADSLKSLTELIVLDIGGNGIRGCKSLTRLRLSSRGVVALSESLPYLTKLEHLDLNWHALSNEEIQALSNGLPHLEQLRYLNLSMNAIGNGGALALSQSLPYLKNLEYLDLNDNVIKNKGALALAQSLPHLTNLRYLDLSKTKIKDKGALAVATSLVNTRTLVYLRLELNYVSTEGVLKIKEILRHLPKLIPIGFTSQANTMTYYDIRKEYILYHYYPH